MALRKENVLIVDDDYDMLELLHRHLRAMEFHTYRASSVHEAIEILHSGGISLVITDLQMPGPSGIELIKYCREHFPGLPKLVITGFPTVDNAVGSIKAGAVDFLTKPFTGDEFRKAVQNALRESAAGPVADTRRKTPSTYGGMTGNSARFDAVVDIIERVKDNRATILITGESGTGKELVARAIHNNGAFAKEPFIAVNCGAIPENLLESELFGFVKGSFTGAAETRPGLFEKADGGTIFLDEIGNAPAHVQLRLLRVLQEKEVYKIGAAEPVRIKVRIIAATNSNLQEMVKNGKFREDLYYRLNVVHIETPSLRDRKEDIGPLVQAFLAKYASEFGKPVPDISDDAKAALMRHDWPGNVRELENIVQRLLIMTDGNIDIGHLPEHLKYGISAHDNAMQPLREIERNHILKVLSLTGNNKTRAAEILGIDRKTLRMKLGENG